MNIAQGIVWCSFRSQPAGGFIPGSKEQSSPYHLHKMCVGDPALERRWLGTKVSRILPTLVSMQFQDSGPNDGFPFPHFDN